MIRLLLLTRLFPQCRLCGVKLQTVDKTRPGYFVAGVAKQPLAKTQKYDELELKLSDADRALLGLGPLAATSTKAHSHDLELTTAPECTRCRDVQYRLQMVQPLPPLGFHEMMDYVDPTAPVVVVVSALDFPMGFDGGIFRHRSPTDVRVVVNKADLWFSTNQKASKYGATFVEDYFAHKHGIPRHNVAVVLAKLGWNVAKLASWLPQDAHVVGHVNLGKLTLVGQLQLQHLRHEGDVPLTLLQRRQLEKLQDKGIHTTKALMKKRLHEKMALVVGPGTLYMPGYTRGVIATDISATKTIYDVPGYDVASGHGVFGLLNAQLLAEGRHRFKHVSKGAKVFDKGDHWAHYESVTKRGQVLLFGGLFGVEFPGGIFQVRNVTAIEPTKFRDYDKFEAVRAEPLAYDGMELKFFGVGTENLTRYIIPPFYGPVDVVLRGLGHLSITPTGRKELNDAIAVYLPPHLDAVARQPITGYIAKLLTGRDKNGNVLRKENMKKSTLALRRYAAKTPLTAQLIPSPSRAHDADAIAKWSGTPYDDTTVIDEHNRYDYWRE